MFTQSEIAKSFGLTRQRVTQALGGRPSVEIKMSRPEGRRTISRNLKHYSSEDAFSIAMGSGKLPEYRAMCESKGLEPKTFHVTRSEVTFGERLRRFLPDSVRMMSQYQVDNYRIDFFLPDFLLAIEYDERHHRMPGTQETDRARQDHLESAYSFQFVRIAEGEEYQGMFRIAALVLAKPSGS